MNRFVKPDDRMSVSLVLCSTMSKYGDENHEF